MTAAAGLLGFGAAADGSLAEYDGVFAASVNEVGAVSETTEGLAVFPNATSDAVTAADAAAAQAAFANILDDSDTVADASSAVATFANTIADTSFASDATDPSAVYANAITGSISASDTHSNVVDFNPPVTEVETVADAQSSSAVFVGSYSATAAADESVYSIATFANAVADSVPANDNSVSAFVGVNAQFEAGSASDALDPVAFFVASRSESLSAGTSTTVDVGISIIEGGPIVDLNDDSLLGFGPIGGGALAAFGGLFVDVARDLVGIEAVYNSARSEAGSASDYIDSYRILRFSQLETVTAIDLVAAKYGVNYSYIDTEVVCVPAEPRMMRSQAEWKAAATPEQKDARGLPVYKPRAETRKRAC